MNNADLAFGLQSNLEIEGYEVRVAEDGRAGLELATEWQPHLVVLDLMLPELVAALKRAKAADQVLALLDGLAMGGPAGREAAPEIVERLGGGVEIAVPEATPELGMAQYLGNALQIGLLAVAFVAASSLAFDSKPEMSAFLRTRTTIRKILEPRYAVNMAASAGSFALGSAIAFAVTAALIAMPRLGGTIVGSVLIVLYLCFTVAVTGLSLPGAAVMTLVGGAIFGVLWGTVIVSFASNGAALGAFLDVAAADRVDDGSSRGPAAALELLKPDLTAPGTRIFAATAVIPPGITDDEFLRVSGTSMASPHVAGAAAVRRTVESAPGLGITTLTLYAFSSDNWRRAPSEVGHLMRLFQKHLNCVPTRYYLELRLAKARQLLLQTSMSIVDVAFASGFVLETADRLTARGIAPWLDERDMPASWPLAREPVPEPPPP